MPRKRARLLALVTAAALAIGVGAAVLGSERPAERSGSDVSVLAPPPMFLPPQPEPEP